MSFVPLERISPATETGFIRDHFTGLVLVKVAPMSGRGARGDPPALHRRVKTFVICPAVQTVKKKKAATKNTKDAKNTNGKTEDRRARTFALLLLRPPANILARVPPKSAPASQAHDRFLDAFFGGARARMLQCEALRSSRGAKARASQNHSVSFVHSTDPSTSLRFFSRCLSWLHLFSVSELLLSVNGRLSFLFGIPEMTDGIGQ